MNIRTRLLIVEIIVVLGACGFFFYFGLGAFGLVGADEPRYAQIAREMFDRRDWIVPTLNGTPWLEKPVLLYWKAMGSYMVYGVHDWAARLPAATYATGLVLAIFLFMRRFRAGSELDAALITASMTGIIGFARGASTDMMVSAPFCAAMLAWWAWRQTGRKLWLAAFYALLAAGMLAKGPVAPALAVMIVAAYSILRRDGKALLRSLWLPGVLLFFAMALPWYIAIQIKVPQFFRIFFIQHNLERFGTNLYQHSRPFWYYIPVFLLSTLPWIVFTAPALVEAVRNGVSGLRAKNNGGEEGAAPAEEAGDWLPLFLALWIAIPVIFFSVSRSKLPGYILPAIPPAAVLTADYLHRRQSISRLQLMLHSLLCGAMVAGALLAPWVIRKQALTDQVRTVIIVATGAIAILVLVIVRRGGLRVLHFATLVPMVLAAGFLLRPAASTIDQSLSARPVAERMTELGVPPAPLAVFNVKRDVEYGLNFYRNQPVTRYERDGVPGGVHVVVAPEGSAGAVQALAGPRQVTDLGNFPPQHLEFFLVSNAR
jgi:4-amino-4-deoxy-L-arabinose transferase-like glycosyltransferase